MKRFLVINPFGIGDVLFTTPLLRNIKLQVPEAFIGYVANRRAAPALEANPDVDRLMIYERDAYHALGQRSRLALWRAARDQLREIRALRFDAVIDCSLNTHAGWLMALAGIRTRIGFDYKGRGRFLTRRIPFSGYEGRHVTEHYLSLLEILGLESRERGLSLPVTEEDRNWAADFLQARALQPGTAVAVFPGGGASWGRDARYKRWDPARYAAAADKMIEKFKTPIILMGSFSEKDLGAEVAGQMRHPCCQAFDQTLRQTAALLRQARAAVVNDGGPLHIAAASGIPTVSIFGPVDEKVYGPYPPRGHEVVTADIACRPCYRNFRRAACGHLSCLSRVTPEQVAARVEHILQDRQVESRIFSEKGGVSS